MILTSAVLAALTFAATAATAADAPPPGCSSRPPGVSALAPKAPKTGSAVRRPNQATPRRSKIADGGTRARRARQEPRRQPRLPRLPHADEDGSQGSGARHVDGAVRPSREARHAAAAEARRRRGAGSARARNTAFAGPWGITYAINLTLRPRHRHRQMARRGFRAGDQDRQAHGRRPPDHAAHALARLQEPFGCAAAGDVRLSQDGSAGEESRTRLRRRRNEHEAPHRARRRRSDARSKWSRSKKG